MDIPTLTKEKKGRKKKENMRKKRGREKRDKSF